MGVRGGGSQYQTQNQREQVLEPALPAWTQWRAHSKLDVNLDCPFHQSVLLGQAT